MLGEIAKTGFNSMSFAKKPERLSGFLAALLVTSALSGTPVHAACLTPNNTALEVNFPDYPLWKIVAGEMEQCGNVKVSYGFDASLVAPDPLNVDKDLGALVGVSNASLYRLSSQRLLRPLDDLVEANKDRLHERQLIRVNGSVVAIAVAANTKALLFHADLFGQENIIAPRTYDQLFSVAAKLKGSKLHAYSLSLAFKSNHILCPSWAAIDARAFEFCGILAKYCIALFNTW